VNAASFSAQACTATLLLAVLAGCDNMQHQDNVRSFQASPHFADGASARRAPAHTVARGGPALNDPVIAGRKDGDLLTELPIPLTRALLERGRERFNLSCAPCHGEDGYGRGIVVQKGFPAPPAYFEPWLLKAPAGHFYEVITHGIGRMYPLADRIMPRDRWAIVAYIRALQRSQRATKTDLPADELRRLTAP
jgi:mono/diheme cytochrome c family protein